MKISFVNVKKLTKEEWEKARLWKAIFGNVKIERTYSGIDLIVDGRKHQWRKANLQNNFLYSLLKSKAESVTFSK